MLVKSYEDEWFGGAIVNYLKTKKKDHTLDSDKILFS